MKKMTYCSFINTLLSQSDQNLIDGIIYDQLMQIDSKRSFVTLPKIVVSDCDRSRTRPITSYTGWASISIDIRPGITDLYAHAREQELRTSIVHESALFMRLRDRGYTESFGTLSRALISEGLACRAVEDMGLGVPVYASNLNESEISAYAKSICQHRDSDYDYTQHFANEADPKGAPLWAGYNLGYTIVAAKLSELRRSAFSVIDLPAERFTLAIPAVVKTPPAQLTHG